MSRAALTVAITAVAAVIVGCSSNKTHVTATPPPHLANVSQAPTTAATPAVTSSASSAPASTASAAGPLSGSWTGQYSGAYQGTFVLRWQQSGSALTGNIALSAPADTLSINGTVSGGTISFGTVGSFGITYSGSVSGGSMSGTYRVLAGGGSGGPWSATKSP